MEPIHFTLQRKKTRNITFCTPAPQISSMMETPVVKISYDNYNDLLLRSDLKELLTEMAGSKSFVLEPFFCQKGNCRLEWRIPTKYRIW